jgi:hypothetical protein
MRQIKFNTVIGKDQVIRPPEGVELSPGEAEVVVFQDHPRDGSKDGNSFLDRLANAAKESGIEELPSDLAENHDHYAHGAPKGIDRR